MKKMFFLLLLPAFCFGQGTKKMSALPLAPAVDSNSSFAGTQLSGGAYTDLRFNTRQLVKYLKDTFSTATTSPGGSDRQIQINQSGVFGATADLTYGGNALTVAPGGVTSFIVTDTGVILANKLYVKTGTNTMCDSVTLTNGTVTVFNTAITKNSWVITELKPLGLNIGAGTVSVKYYVSAVNPGVSFIITGLLGTGLTNTADNSKLKYWIIN